MTRVIFHTLTS